MTAALFKQELHSVLNILPAWGDSYRKCQKAGTEPTSYKCLVVVTGAIALYMKLWLLYDNSDSDLNSLKLLLLIKNIKIVSIALGS